MKCTNRRCNKDYSDSFKFCPYCGKSSTPVQPKKRRAKGSGCIYKRKNCPNKPYVARTSQKDSSKSIIVGSYKTYAEADEALHRIKSIPIERINYTLSQLYEEWKSVWFSGIQKDCKDSYSNAWKHITPLHNKPVRNIKTADYEGVVATMKENGLSLSNMKKVKLLAGLLSKHAMKNDIIDKNYGSLIKLPRTVRSVKAAVTEDEISLLVHNVGKVPDADLLVFMCYTGLRISEFVGLKKSQVHICKVKADESRPNSEDNFKNAYFLYGGIKTEAGENKIIPIHPTIVPVFEKHFQNPKNETEYVFINENTGRKFTSSNFREKHFYRVIDAIEGMRGRDEKGNRIITPHATRRALATMMSKYNVREENFITIMGHANYQMDIDAYIKQSAEKLYPEMLKIK